MNLSPMEHSLLIYMRAHGVGCDIPIANMWGCLVGPAPNPDDFDMRSMQQYVGAFVSRINRKQDEYEIVPGELKRTYRVQYKHKEQ